MLAKTDTARYGLTTAAPVVAVNERKAAQYAWAKCFLYIGGIAVALIMLYFMPITLNERGQEVQKVRERVIQLTEENEMLQLKVNRLKSLDRIQMIAETELGMMIPAAAVYSQAAASRH